MRKEALLIFSIFMIGLLIVSFVSANFFSDFFGKITGNVINECFDGTLVNQCSLTKPKYCIITFGSPKPLLVDDCTECGCLEDYVCQSDGTCKENLEEITCKEEGESVSNLLPDPPNCCEGLILIKPKFSDVVGSLGICTVKCRNGVCDAETETPYNCPADCGNLAYFKFEVNEETFIIQLTDPQKIQTAREILNSNVLRDNRHVRGIIIKEQVSYNGPWVYHLDPSSVSFPEISIELCDAAIEQINENIITTGNTMLPGDSWCPWSARLIEELDCENKECSNEVVFPDDGACEDGTIAGECSTTKPKYCNDVGVLIDDCQTCGCSEDYDCQDDGSCSEVAEVIPSGGNLIQKILEWFRNLFGGE